MRITIETIPHKAQRYPTCGDWQFSPHGLTPAEALAQGETLFVRVSRMGDWRYEALVGIHEAIEAVLCRAAGIKEEDVTAFDVAYESRRPPENLASVRLATGERGCVIADCGCEVTSDSEPGDDPHAPYYHAHQIATSVERILAAELGVDWNAYEAKVNAL